MSERRGALPRVLVERRGRLGRPGAAWDRRAGRLLRGAARQAGLSARHELSLLLCDAAAMRRINRRWRGLDRPTDVLSFPLHRLAEGQAPPAGPVGDVVVSLSAVRAVAREARREAARGASAGRASGRKPKAALPMAEFETLELHRLLVHGLLHLLGYDHHRDDQALRMERQERRLLGAGPRS